MYMATDTYYTPARGFAMPDYVKKLSPAETRCVILCGRDRLTFAEAARKLKRNPATVRNAVGGAIAKTFSRYPEAAYKIALANNLLDPGAVAFIDSLE